MNRPRASRRLTDCVLKQKTPGPGFCNLQSIARRALSGFYARTQAAAALALVQSMHIIQRDTLPANRTKLPHAH